MDQCSLLVLIHGTSDKAEDELDHSEVLKFEQQQQITKVSQAIRIGAKIRPQCRGTFFRDGGSCAMGAMAEAMGVPYGSELPLMAVAYALWVPATIAFAQKVRMTLPVANDTGWTREQIADKLEELGY